MSDTWRMPYFPKVRVHKFTESLVFWAWNFGLELQWKTEMRAWGRLHSSISFKFVWDRKIPNFLKGPE